MTTGAMRTKSQAHGGFATGRGEQRKRNVALHDGGERNIDGRDGHQIVGNGIMPTDKVEGWLAYAVRVKGQLPDRYFVAMAKPEAAVSAPRTLSNPEGLAEPHAALVSR